MQIIKYVISRGNEVPKDKEYDNYDDAAEEAQAQANMDHGKWWVLERVYEWDEYEDRPVEDFDWEDREHYEPPPDEDPDA